jgi:hypothetical protein
MAKSRSAFTTVRSEGGLLPADLLTRIVAEQASGLDAQDDYHLPPNERKNEAISRSWNRLVGAWATFKDALARLPPDSPATRETRERWLLVLFSELGFGRLQAAHAVEIDGRSYPVSHVWNAVPIHLVGAGLSIDRRARGQAGAARTSPHGLLQELLNAAPQHLWGIVSNGRLLRLLRDNVAMTRQAYLEFDLEEMMDGQVYSDFVLLWLVAHESRFEGEQPADCWLEKWTKEAQQAGVRALDHLRDGVERAIEALGRGFIAHRDNGRLRERLRSGELDAQECYRQLLRVVYRLIFLFVAEDRDLLLSPDATPTAREVYLRHYSLGRLRRLADRRRGATLHGDLWRALSLVMDALGSENGCAPLGLPALGSFLWSAKATAAFLHCELANRDLLRAVAALAFVTDGKVVRQVDYRNLGPEELGSVYESLLERHPRIDLAAGTFELATVSGNERKTTGSYYTPTSLIACLLDSAMDPVLDEAARQPDPEAAILALRVVDPACGSGHFLIAAAHRIARRLAAVRSGDEEPSPEEVRHALRHVIGRCVYGVDVNPMAVELCKVSLWIEALDPGRPLSFLDQHVQCGHSLIGATPELLDAGIPDEAFKAIEGDDKQFVASLRKRNRAERSGQMSILLGDAQDERRLRAPLAAGLAELDVLPDDSLPAVQEKERRYAVLIASPEARRANLVADAWCAAFVAPKRDGEPAVTEEVRLRLAAAPDTVPALERERVEALAADFRFFHWHLAFAEVFEEPGGFDVVLGNPPWERVKLQEQEFFSARDPELAATPGARRKRLIAELRQTNPALDAEWRAAVRRSDGVSHFMRDSGRFPLCGRGDVNTYSVFAETMRALAGPRGRAGIIVPTGIATDDTTKEFFASLVDRRGLVSLFDFWEARRLFSDIDQRSSFCLLTMTGVERPAEAAMFVFAARRVEDLTDEDRRFQLTPADFRLLNPNTRTCPIFRSRRDMEITRRIYEQVPVLVDRTRPDGNPWGASFLAMFHMTNDSGLFRTREQLADDGWTLEGNVFRRGEDAYLPLYEAKLFHHFDHRFNTYETDDDTRPVTEAEKRDPGFATLPRYWVPKSVVDDALTERSAGWLLAWRDIARSVDERTAIVTALPAVGVGHKAPLAFVPRAQPQSALAANLTAFVTDFAARNKVGGSNMTYFLVEQLPVLPPATFAAPAPWDCGVALDRWIAPRVAELCCTAVDMQPLARELGLPHAPFRWDDARRELLRAELDAAFFHLYGLPREDVDYVLETFPIVRRKDERAHGEYRTKRLVLERYDALAAAIESGVPYETVLDPPPAHPGVAHGAQR